MCESCLRQSDLTYLNADLCNYCKGKIQEYRFEGGAKTTAVKSFEKKHPYEFEHGCVKEYKKRIGGK